MFVPGFETSIVNYGTDIPNLQGRHRRYLYGPGSILVAHSDHEEVRAEDLERAVVGYKTLVLWSLGKGGDAGEVGGEGDAGEDACGGG